MTCPKGFVKSKETKDNMSDLWEFTSPEGQIYVQKNLTQFANDHGLIATALIGVANGRCTHHRGWKCRKLTPKVELNIDFTGIEEVPVNRTWFDNNVFTKKGSLNNKVVELSWWNNRGFLGQYKYLEEKTKFLDKPSITQRIYHLYNGILEIPKCKHCLTGDVEFLRFKDGYRDYCSIQCVTQSEERNRKIAENNDYETLHKKARQTCLERYGSECSFNTEEAKKKGRETKKLRYGDENYCNREQAKQTNLERYGVTCPLFLPHSIENRKKENAKKFPQLRNKEWLIERNKHVCMDQIAREVGVTSHAVHVWFQKHGIQPIYHTPDFHQFQRKIEKDIKEKFDVNMLINDRIIIKPKELDIYFPDYKVAIEINGMFWHSEDEYKHINKLKLCEEKNIRLIQFWDEELDKQNSVCMSIISSALGFNNKIYARDCEIKELDNKTYNEFLEKNHIQGSIPSKIKIGLYNNDILVMVMGFGKSRYNQNYEYELIRSCSVLNTSVIGGFSKLLKYALKTYYIKSLISYCDIRLFDGEGYRKFGFEKHHRTLPGYFYYKSRSKETKSRLECQKHKLIHFLDKFDSELTEEENMINNGWLRVYDCRTRRLCVDKRIKS